MPSNVKHQFTSGKADDADATLIRPSNWNDEHVGALEVMDRDLTQVDVENTTDEESLYSHSIPAGQLGATGGVRLTLSGDCLRNVTPGSFQLKVKLGATTVLTTLSKALAQDANRYKWTLTVWFLNSATDAQKWGAFFSITAGAEDFALIDVGDAADTGIIGNGVGSSSEDTTGALTLDVTVDLSVANANFSFRKEMAILEELPAV